MNPTAVTTPDELEIRVDTTMQYGVEEGAKSGFARVDALLRRLRPKAHPQG